MDSSAQPLMTPPTQSQMPTIISPTGKPKRSMRKLFFPLVGIIVLLATTATGVILVRRNQNIKSGATTLCDNFAHPGEAHCNTQQCQQYTCQADGTWSAAQGTGVCSTHSACGGGGTNPTLPGGLRGNKCDWGSKCCSANADTIDGAQHCWVEVHKCNGPLVDGKCIVSNPEKHEDSYCIPSNFCGSYQLDIMCDAGSPGTGTQSNPLAITSTGNPPTCTVTTPPTTTTTTTPTDTPTPTPTPTAPGKTASPTPTAPGRTASPTPTATPTNPPDIIARCVEVLAYDTNWVAINPDRLGQLKSGDVVRFTVRGSASEGTITQARFTINGTLRTPVTSVRPGTEAEFFDEYTIPAIPAGQSTLSISVKGEVYHPAFNTWF